MQYSVTTNAITSHLTDCIVVAVFDQGKLSPSAAVIDQKSKGYIKKMIKRGDISGRAGKHLLLQDVAGMTSPRVLLVGCGKKDETSEDNFNSALKAMAKVLNECGACHATSCLSEINVRARKISWAIKQTIIKVEETLYKYHETKSKTHAPSSPLAHLDFFAQKSDADLNIAIKTGAAIAEGINLARTLGNLPGNICTPSYLANKAIDIGNQFTRVTTTVLEEKDMEALGMGSLLSVSHGSEQPAKLIIMNYQGANEKRPVVLVGKGLTFDAGGISLKPSSAMDEMKYDMCGGASVFGAMMATAKLELPINLIGVIPSSENLPDGNATKPGDVVTSMSGKTIEILNTDAEGRLILCDALTYSKRFNPDIIIDIATLTGAIIVALGHQTTGMMANNQTLADALLQAGNESHDRAWQLPLWDAYQPQLDSRFADMANIGGKGAGSITAACFLSRFIEEFSWAHLDIAGTAWQSGKNKSATGRPVPLLMQFLLNYIADKQSS